MDCEYAQVEPIVQRTFQRGPDRALAVQSYLGHKQCRIQHEALH
jgi:hypothetical protein